MVDAIAINLGLGYGDILANPVKLKEFNQNSVTQENLSKPRRPGYLPSHRVLRRGVPQYVRYYGGDQRNYNRMLEDTVDEALEIAQVDRRTEDDDVRGRCPWCPTDFEVRAWQDMGAEGPPTDPRAYGCSSRPPFLSHRPRGDSETMRQVPERYERIWQISLTFTTPATSLV